jgi:hypothetical protein
MLEDRNSTSCLAATRAGSFQEESLAEEFAPLKTFFT